jgi:hypothetical protein
MIWHILKKDLRLLWPIGATLLAVQLALIAVDFQMGHFHRDDPTLRSLLLLLEIVLYVGGGCLIAVLVHQDAIVGDCQDWLSRPVRRRDLLGAKLLFLVLLLQMPILLFETAEGLAEHVSFAHALLPAVSQNIWFVAAFTLPVLALASVTRSLTEAAVSMLGLFLLVICWELPVKGATGGSPLGPAGDSGIAWIPEALRLLLYVFASAAILSMQYFHRWTRRSRIVLVAAALLCLTTELLPWRLVFGLQELASGPPSDAPGIGVEFDSAATRYKPPVTSDATKDASAANATDAVALYLPLMVRGLPAGDLLKVDRAVVWVRSPENRQKVVVSSEDDSGDVEIPNDEDGTSAKNLDYERIALRPAIYHQLRSVPVSLEVDYSLTLLRRSSVHRLQAEGGDARFADSGWCQARLNVEQTEVDMRCLQAGNAAQCATYYLENPATGVRNPSVHGCRDDYDPWFGRYKPLHTMTSSGADLTFRDPEGLLHYPIDAAHIGGADVVIESYQPIAHFTRRITLPGVHLSEWVAP